MRLWIQVPMFLLCISALAAEGRNCDSSQTNSKVEAPDVNAAALVRAVRESENWIHRVDSLQIRIESTWTITPAGLAATQAELKQNCPETTPEPNQSHGLSPISRGTLEYAIDRQRLRFRHDTPGQFHTLRVWDGKQAISYAHFLASRQEHYYLGSAPDSVGKGLFFPISWPRSQPHSFWWDPTDAEEYLKYFGYPQDFVIVGRTEYRGLDCYVLDVSPGEVLVVGSGQSCPWHIGTEDGHLYGLIGEVRGLVGQSYRWYVGTEDYRLHGLVGLTDNKPHIEHYMLDYRQVAPGCWFPMTQGYEVYQNRTDGQSYLQWRRDLRVLDVSINEKLPDELFEVDFKEGVKVYDERSGGLVTYAYEPEPPDLVGKDLPAFAGVGVDFASDQAKDTRTLVCFWDMYQRPSRHCIRQLAIQTEQFKQKGITFVAVHASKIDKKALNEWLSNNNIPFPVGMVEGDEEKTRFAWGVKSLPWLILTDRQHIVRAEGFALNELDKKMEASNRRD